METETDIVEVYTVVSNLARNMESTNTISIYLHDLIKEFIEEDETGIVTHLGSSHIRLKPHDFTPRHLSELLLDQQVTHSRDLGQHIARRINHSLANDNSLREPVFVSVGINFITERRFVLPPTSSRSASWEIFQRLVEEQRVESMDLDEEENESQCSICIDNLSKSRENIIRMPRCLHMFHQDCLFEWLGRQNSCPLCRGVPYEDQNRSRAESNEATA